MTMAGGSSVLCCVGLVAATLLDPILWVCKLSGCNERQLILVDSTMVVLHKSRILLPFMKINSPVHTENCGFFCFFPRLLFNLTKNHFSRGMDRILHK